MNRHAEVADQKDEQTARVFSDIGGYYVCADTLPYLDTRGAVYGTKMGAMRAAYLNGWKYAVGSGTYSEGRTSLDKMADRYGWAT